MPHECTSCGRVFQDGSKEMLSGCPECGGNKFQYRPRSRTDDASGSAEGTTRTNAASEPVAPPDESAGDDAATSAGGAPADAGRPGRPGNADREPTRAPTDSDASVVERRTDPPSGGAGASGRGDPDGDGDGTEDRAQADARSGVVTPEELDAAASRPRRAPDAAPEAGADTDADRPSIDQLRQELNDQFESIRIVSPGKYELNLMELYNREEYVISLQEDGRYVIEVPESWRRPDDG